VIGAAAEHARPPPPELLLGPLLVGVGLAGHLPAAADGCVIVAEAPVRGAFAAQWRLLRGIEHRRLFGRLVIPARFQHQDLDAVQAEQHGHHAAARAGADYDDIIFAKGLAVGEDGHGFVGNWRYVYALECAMPERRLFHLPGKGTPTFGVGSPCFIAAGWRQVSAASSNPRLNAGLARHIFQR